MSSFEKTIHVAAPVRAVYNQWTQIETFPLFMAGVDRVVQVDDRTLDWTATIGGQTRTWRARITEQLPDQETGGWRGAIGGAPVVVPRRTGS